MFKDINSDQRKSGIKCIACANSRRSFKGRFYNFPKDKSLFDVWLSKCKVSIDKEGKLIC